MALPGRERLVQGTGLDIDDVGGEGARVTAEQRVRQRHVAPVEALQMQPHQQHGERVEQALGGVLARDLAEHGPVGEGELQMAGDQHGVQRLAGAARATGDHGEGLDRGDADPAEHLERVVLALGEVVVDLLEREHPPRDPDEADHMAGDAAGERGQDLVGPLFQRRLPGQIQQCRVCTGRGDLQGCHGSILSRARGPGPYASTFHVGPTGRSRLRTSCRRGPEVPGNRPGADGRGAEAPRPPGTDDGRPAGAGRPSCGAGVLSRRGACPTSRRRGAGGPPWDGSRRSRPWSGDGGRRRAR